MGMHGPTCIVWANLTPFSLKGSKPPALDDVEGALRLGADLIELESC
jgi:hypothetical protein